jgi:hypothetical protein
MRWKTFLVMSLAIPAAGMMACVDETGDGGSGQEGAGADTATDPSEGGDSNGSSSSSSSSSSSGSYDPECPHEGPPLLDPSTLPLCPSYVCDNGTSHCIPKGLVPTDMHSLVEECNDESFCVPDPFIETGGNWVPPTCTAVMGLEGRCVSSCIPMVAAQADFLKQDICSEGELCAPCWDPINEQPSGACELSCDPGSTEAPPDPFQSCCPNGDGSCVPAELVPAANQGSLAQDTCPESSQLCVPNEMLGAPLDPAPCAPALFWQLLGIDDGACVHNCVDAVKGLGQGDCPSGYNCAPCEAMGEPTGACGDDW